jgi:hypothetical protein
MIAELELIFFDIVGYVLFHSTDNEELVERAIDFPN